MNMFLFHKITPPAVKLLTSFINCLTALVMAVPLFIYLKPDIRSAVWILIYMFFIHNTIPLFFKERRDIGMVIMGTYWQKKYSFGQHVVYNILYTLSFATLFFYKFFPLDIFLINIFFVQLPCILLTGATLHGFLSGKMVTINK